MDPKIFKDANRWRMHLFSENTKVIQDLYRENYRGEEIGGLVLDLRDKFASAIKDALANDAKTDQNTLNLVISIPTMNRVISVLSEQKKYGFELGQLIYDEMNEVPVCVIAASGATFFAIKNLK